jgi:hypothetical protein
MQLRPGFGRLSSAPGPGRPTKEKKSTGFRALIFSNEFTRNRVKFSKKAEPFYHANVEEYIILKNYRYTE